MSVLELVGWFVVGYLRFLAWGVPIAILIGIAYDLALRFIAARRMPRAIARDPADRTWRRFE